jgi:hypothetical protein
VTAAVFGLANSATSNASLQVIQASAQGGAASGSTGVNYLTLTVKNSGSTTISGTLVVTMGGTVQPATAKTAPVPTVGCSATATCVTAATMGGTTGNPVLLNVGTLTLPAGSQVTINEGAITGLTTGWNVGSQYTVAVQFGPAQTSIVVTA